MMPTSTDMQQRASDAEDVSDDGASVPRAESHEQHDESKKAIKGKKAKGQKHKQVKGMPRRPPTAYNLFFRDERQNILGAGGPVSALTPEEASAPEFEDIRKISAFQAIAKIVAFRWKRLGGEGQRSFQNRAKELLVEYEKKKQMISSMGSNEKKEFAFSEVMESKPAAMKSAPIPSDSKVVPPHLSNPRAAMLDAEKAKQATSSTLLAAAHSAAVAPPSPHTASLQGLEPALLQLQASGLAGRMLPPLRSPAGPMGTAGPPPGLLAAAAGPSPLLAGGGSLYPQQENPLIQSALNQDLLALLRQRALLASDPLAALAATTPSIAQQLELRRNLLLSGLLGGPSAAAAAPGILDPHALLLSQQSPAVAQGLGLSAALGHSGSVDPNGGVSADALAQYLLRKQGRAPLQFPHTHLPGGK